MAQKRKDSTLAQQLEQFFLYTKLNENDTKTLRKAQTNKEERRVLSNIFNLQTIPSPFNQNRVNKIDVLLLDFHYINYEFCKENYFSNEKVSTLLAIMDFIFHYMLDKQIIPETGYKILKQILDKHSLQRPPFSILIFEQQDIQKILQFTIKTFFRHFSLYESAFKPRMELVLKFEPFINDQYNAEQRKLEEMVLVDNDDAEKLKVYLNIFNQQLDGMAADADPLHSGALVSDRQHVGSTRQSQLANEEDLHEQLDQEVQINWKKVGKPYSGNDDIMSVLEREMSRLKTAMEMKIVAQDVELEEKVNIAKGKKK